MELHPEAVFFDGTTAKQARRFTPSQLARERYRRWRNRNGWRRLLGKPRKIDCPHWFLIGVPKAGTTSLYEALRRHPQIVLPAGKESQFFCSAGYFRGPQWFLQHHYGQIPPGRSVGDMSPKYLIHRSVPVRMKETLRHTPQFIVVLRNPVDRLWSHYCHAYHRFRDQAIRPTEELSLEEGLQAEPRRMMQVDPDGNLHGSWLAYFYTGLYALHLEYWFSQFGRDRFLVLLLEDLAENPTKSLSDVLRHIGVDDISPDLELPKVNSMARPGLDEDLRRRLINAYRPWNDRLAKLLGRDLSIWEDTP